MGFFKKVKKTVSKAVKDVTEAPVKLAKETTEAVTDGIKGIVGGNKGETQVVQNAPTVQNAPEVETAKTDDADTDDGSQTESGRKKARATGKKALSVARSAGGGLNI